MKNYQGIEIDWFSSLLGLATIIGGITFLFRGDFIEALLCFIASDILYIKLILQSKLK